jgi:hypothetical protein
LTGSSAASASSKPELRPTNLNSKEATAWAATLNEAVKGNNKSSASLAKAASINRLAYKETASSLAKKTSNSDVRRSGQLGPVRRSSSHLAAADPAKGARRSSAGGHASSPLNRAISAQSVASIASVHRHSGEGLQVETASSSHSSPKSPAARTPSNGNFLYEPMPEEADAVSVASTARPHLAYLTTAASKARTEKSRVEFTGYTPGFKVVGPEKVHGYRMDVSQREISNVYWVVYGSTTHTAHSFSRWKR